jgi:elongation factor Ts
MANITAAAVMKLRDATNLPMMKCKEALTASNGDEAAAIEWLRKQGVSAKLTGRETPNGGIGMAIGGGAGVLVQLGCQTDFVSGNEVFKALVKQIAEAALASSVASLDAVKAMAIGGKPVADLLTTAIQQMGENLVLVGFVRVSGAVVAGYNHGGRVAALVAGSGDGERLRKIAMHIASASPAPVALNRAAVDPVLVKKEEELLLATPEVQAKPEAMRPKIVQGKLSRFFKENVLLEQEMLLDAEKGESVEAYAKRLSLTVTGFGRLTV